MEGKGYFSEVCVQIQVHGVANDESPPLPSAGVERGDTSQRETYGLLLGRKGEGREFLLCLLFSVAFSPR